MVHTLPDYTTKHRMATIFGQIDQGELAARLGSINTFDRRGNVSWMDDFESGVGKWNKSGDGAGYDVTASDVTARNGKYSLLLTCGSSGAMTAQAQSRFMPPLFEKIGYEFHFWMDANITNMFFRPTIVYGGAYYTAGFNFDEDNNKIQYWNSANTWTDILTDVNWYHAMPHWYDFKFVVDYATGKYVRALLGQTSLTVSGIDVRSGTTAGADTLNHLIDATGAWGVNGKCYIDDVIVTQNEP